MTSRHPLLPALSLALLLSSCASGPRPEAQAQAQEAPDQAVPRTQEYPWMSVAEWRKRHDAYAAAAAKGGADIVFYGDSITEGLQYSAPFKEKLLPRKALCLAIGGDRTQNLLWRIENGEAGTLDPKHIFLLIGTNNFGHLHHSPGQVALGVAAVLRTLRSRFPKAVIHVQAIFPAGEQPSDPVRGQIQAANVLLAAMDDGKLTRFHDFGELFLDEQGRIPRGLMADFLHPTEKGQAKWVAALEPLLAAGEPK